jgi:L-lactate dehydrogenase
MRLNDMQTNNMTYKRKVSIIGAGYVGASIAYALMTRELSREIVLIDINEKASMGEALDIKHGIPYMGSAMIYSGDYPDIVDSDLIIITAGRNRKPGEDRLQLASDNIKIAKSVTDQIKLYYNKGIILVVTNPVDIITYNVAKWMNLPNGRVFGTGCILDTSRLVSVIADYLSLSSEVVNGFVAGEHGDAQFPVWSKMTIAGVSIYEYCESVGKRFDEEIQNQLTNRVIKMGANIIENKGKTHYGIATCVAYLADAVLNRRPTIASVASVFSGEYGINDCALSVPSIVSGNGVEKRIVERMDDNEFANLKKSKEKICIVLNNFNE